MSYTNTTSLTNLATHTITIPTTDTYSFQGTLTLPNLIPTAIQGPGGGAGTGTGGGTLVPSQVVVTIKQNGTTIFTSNPGAMGFCLPAVQCTAADVITIQRSSSLPQDQQPQAVRMTLAVSEGGL
jgi:hypothetical protein